MPKTTDFTFDWSDLAFDSKKPIHELHATFIAAPREMSAKRFTQLVKGYLPKGNIVLGIAKEPFADGFEGQPQFKTLSFDAVQSIIAKVNNAATPWNIYTLHYAQRDLPYIFQKLDFRQVVLVNGSWRYSFHTQAPYYELMQRHTPYDMVSPFADEGEARDYEKNTQPHIETFAALPVSGSVLTETEMLETAARSALRSYDYSFQTGVALSKKTGRNYVLLATAFNKVVPFQTYAMHYGASREKNFSPPHDLNHYDTIHAEVAMILCAQKEKINLKDTTLFINLLPCPSCARMFTETDIAEFVYSVDHSDGYAIRMLEKAGKKVRRLLP